MISIRKLNLMSCKADLANIPEGKTLINTINAFSYNNARKDELFEEALMKGDYLIPDGISIVKACQFLRHTKSKPKYRIAGWDLFAFEMEKLNKCVSQYLEETQDQGNIGLDANVPYWKQQNPHRQKPVVMFMGSSPKVLKLIVENAAEVYPNLEIATYSPPYKPEFTVEDNHEIIRAINDCDPDLLWIGMTAPKQEKWTYANWDRLKIHCHVGTVGAVFDFFAGTYKRAPQIWQDMGLEWFYRLIKEPKRMWRRYIIGNTEFLWLVAREKFGF